MSLRFLRLASTSKPEVALFVFPISYAVDGCVAIKQRKPNQASILIVFI